MIMGIAAKVIGKANNFSARMLKRSISSAVKKQPRGALTFQYMIFKNRVPDFAQINAIKERFSFGEMYLLHGVAMLVKGKAVIVTGPRGIGKTTLMKSLSRKGVAQPIDDGLVILGKKNHGFYVVESGTYPWRKLRANVKRIFPFGKGDQFTSKGFSNKSTEEVAQSALHEAAFSESLASLFTSNKSNQTFSPSIHGVSRLVAFVDKRDIHLPLRVDNNLITKEEIPSTQLLGQNGVNVLTLQGNASRREVMSKMNNFILGE